MISKQEREMRKAVRCAFNKLIKYIKNEPKVIEFEFTGNPESPETEKTIQEIGMWLFHKRE